MTDAQHAAHEQAKKKNDHIKGRILSIVKANPGVTYRGIMREYQARHGQPLAQATAGGRVADLAAEGLIYAQGSTVEDGSTLSMYYYEPDPSCRFRIKVERENEKFLRWLRGAEQFAERLPRYLRDGLRGHATLLSDTMEMARENREG